MRVSTNMIYARGVAQMQMQTEGLLRSQQQVASGRRILTPSDDPIGAARALELTQSKAVNLQFKSNQGNAQDHLNLLENRLVGVQDALQYVRSRAVQAGNAALTGRELGFIATDLRAQYDAMVGLANSQDANNEYLFGGYKTQTQPFQGGFGDQQYQGDQGERTIQVSASRFMPITAPGSEIFSRTQPVTDKLMRAESGTQNTGDAKLAVQVAADFQGGDQNLLGRRLVVEFNAGAYDVYELRPGIAGRATVATGLPNLSTLGEKALPSPPNPADTPNPAYRAVSVSVQSGVAQDGDSFEIFIGSTDVFRNLEVFVDALERPGPSGMAGGESGSAVGFALDMMDAALDNVLKVRAQVGSQMVELENLGVVGSDLDLQYANTLSRIQDVDYAEAVSRLTQQQTYLQAAQQSFMRITGLSLFNFLN